ncbi:MAG TPA: SAM-dependent chlorinase/fluorinase [Actinomycetota bacterium]|jgi:S-adenosylmethionine hydrolase|nr:SAM-dependent chlorinase/fluorinase [Actinomycetota bacterium]
MAGYDWITFTSDYGLEDHFVGVCHGVMARVAPRARVLDVSHAVAPQDVRQGALVLEQAMPYLPRAVHLAVVDPGVGTGRGMVAVQAGGQALVGPDNGLLVWAAEALGGVERAHALANPAYRLDPVSRTFHGRDVFAPAAAHLAAGVDPAELGPEVDPAGLVRLERAAPRVGAGRVGGSVVAVDHFGNLALDLRRQDLEEAGVAAASPLEVRSGGRAHHAVLAETFGSVPAGELLLHEDSFGSLALAVNRGRAADRLGAGPGDPVEVVAAPGGHG